MKNSIIFNVLLPFFLGSTYGCSSYDINTRDIGPIADGTYYVATWGSDDNSGTFDNPFASWQKAVTVSVPGDITYIRGGVYMPKSHIHTGANLGYEESTIGILIRPGTIGAGISGTRDAPICYFAYPGETPIMDGRLLDPTSGFNQGITIEYAQYIHFEGLTVRNIRQLPNDGNYYQAMGFIFAVCANMTIENCTVHDISGKGYGFSSGAWNAWDGAGAPFTSDITRWINCDAYNLCDSLSSNPGNAADGWKCHNYENNVMYFEGCRAWNYSDDGFDQSGSGQRVFENCWAMSTQKYKKFDIEGNGFKTAATWARLWTNPPVKNLVIVKNCIAAYCYGSGFGNGVEGDMYNNAVYFNNISYGNSLGFWDRTINGSHTAIYKNNIAYKSTAKQDTMDPLYEAAIYRPSIYSESNNTWRATQEIDGWPGWIYNPNFTLTDADFLSVIPAGLTAPRNRDGSLPDISFLKLKDNSDLKGAGVDVGMSSKPDIGIDWAYLKSKQ